MKKIIAAVAGSVVAAALLAPAALAQGSGAGGFRMGFTEQGGEALYKNICQGCHMPNAQGGVGAGAYPALAKNPKLEVAGYPIAVVVNGQKAMPGFGSMLSDQQIAEVINYVRTHFGNNYKDAVKPADVKAARS